MSEINGQGYNINEAAEKLNVSTRTIRRHIKAGKIRAVKVKGQFGDEYRILELPEDINGTIVDDEEENLDEMKKNVPADDTVSSLKIIMALQEKNLALAAQLGAATERIKALESQVQLLSAPKEETVPEPKKEEPEQKKSWWKRLFS